MPIKFSCTRCRAPFTVDERFGGRLGRCNRCGQQLRIPPTDFADSAEQTVILQKDGQAARVKRAPAPLSPEDKAIAVRRTLQKLPLQKPHGQKPPAPPPSSVRMATGPLSWLNAMNSQMIVHPIGSERWRPLQRVSISRNGDALPKHLPSSAQQSPWWADAPSSRIKFKPISEREILASHAKEEEADDDQPGPYRLAKPASVVIKNRGSRPAGVVKSSYRGGFHRLARLLRWINQTAYGLSIVFLMLACVGFALQVYANLDSPPPESKPKRDAAKTWVDVEEMIAARQEAQTEPRTAAQPVTQDQTQDGVDETPPARKLKKIEGPRHRHPLLIAGLAGIVLLNVVRLIAGAANLIVIPFRRNPVQGILFLIPPLTLVYIWRHWTTVREPIGRIIGPCFALALVVFAYAFIPGVSRAGRLEGSFRTRIGSSLDEVKRDTKGQVEKTRREVSSLERTLKRDLPRQLQKARKTLDGSREQGTEDREQQSEKAGQALEATQQGIRDQPATSSVESATGNPPRTFEQSSKTSAPSDSRPARPRSPTRPPMSGF